MFDVPSMRGNGQPRRESARGSGLLGSDPRVIIAFGGDWCSSDAGRDAGATDG